MAPEITRKSANHILHCQSNVKSYTLQQWQLPNSHLFACDCGLRGRSCSSVFCCTPCGCADCDIMYVATVHVCTIQSMYCMCQLLSVLLYF